MDEMYPRITQITQIIRPIGFNYLTTQLINNLTNNRENIMKKDLPLWLAIVFVAAVVFCLSIFNCQ